MPLAQPAAEEIHPTTRKALRAWLLKHHTRASGLWLVSYKKETGKPRIDYDEVVEELLAFGWVDSKPNKLDEERSKLWIAPRKPGSGWSGVNKQRIERLLAAGLMHESGLAKIEAAKADGSWTKLDSATALELPADLLAAFKPYPAARGHFDAFPPSTRRAILEWISQAKTEATRSKRVEETARLAQENVRANQWRQPADS
jgi:uncharacterized protein YdeI (YjbR/CyaY-like superfamily)